MSSARQNTSVAPEIIAALSFSVATDRSWWFAGVTDGQQVITFGNGHNHPS